jgi:hypothetical protein
MSPQSFRFYKTTPSHWYQAKRASVIMSPSCRRRVVERFSCHLGEVVAMSRTFLPLVAAGFLLCVSMSSGEGLPVQSESLAPASDQLATLIQQLDGPAFAERQAASQQLEDAGVAAIPTLESIATTGSREAAFRAMDILKRHFQSGSDEEKQAARHALLRLTRSTATSAAQRARDVLNPRQPPSPTARVVFQPAPMPQPRGNIFPGGNFGGGNLGGRMAANGAPLRRVTSYDINGRRGVEIDEQQRKIKMEAAPGGRIVVEITDQQNGQKGTRSIDAKDLDELKRKDAEIGRLYEQFHRPDPRQFGAPFPAVAPVGRAPIAPTMPAASRDSTRLAR